MAEARIPLGCRRAPQYISWVHDIWRYILVGSVFSQLLNPKVAFFYVFVFSYAATGGSAGIDEAVLFKMVAADSRNATDSQKSVDKILQNDAFTVFRHPKSGTIYEATAPSNLSGININAVRLRSGSLRRRGILYNEFEVPVGIVVKPYVKRLVLVYQNFMNWSSVYYNRPGFKLVAPVLGLLAYDASNLSATNLQELNIYATKKPISIRFTNLSTREGSNPMCIFFDLNGTVSLSDVSSPNVCSSFYQGHFSLVIQSLAPAPAPVSTPSPSPHLLGPPPPVVAAPSPSTLPSPNPSPPAKKNSKTWKIAVGSSIGGVVGLAFLGFLCAGFLKYRERSIIEHMEQQADQEEALQTAMVGGRRTPTAGGTRTQPMLESEYST